MLARDGQCIPVIALGFGVVPFVNGYSSLRDQQLRGVGGEQVPDQFLGFPEIRPRCRELLIQAMRDTPVIPTLFGYFGGGKRSGRFWRKERKGFLRFRP